MPTPHIRDLDLPNWHEVPTGATIPAGTRFVRIFSNGEWLASRNLADCHAADRKPGTRYFTAEPITGPREAEIEAEMKRLWEIVYVGVPWAHATESTRDDFRRLAVDSLDRQAPSCTGCGTPPSS